MATTGNPAAPIGPWDEEHVKALLRFPRFPVRLIQQEPWQTWTNQRGGLKATYAYLQNYPLSPNHRRILDVVLSNPEAIADVYANRLNISRATYFYQLRELVPVLVQALNHWEITGTVGEPAIPERPSQPVSTLPTPLTSLVGADTALQTIIPIFLSKEVRLLTLLGPGGVGKTRFSIELAGRMSGTFTDGYCFVDLTALRDPQFVAATISRTLGLKDVSDDDYESQLKSFLRTKEFLLILDNFEHLMPAALLITQLLAAAPALKILVTSRVALHVYGEYEFTVTPLAVPNLEMARTRDQLVQSPAVALFVQRAQAVNPGFSLTPENFETVAQLCIQMEGIPLAIELIASHIKYFSPQALLIRISNSKRLLFLSHALKRLPSRQQTLRGMLDWSYILLSPELQTLFNRLGVFAGGCTIEAASEICASNKFLTRDAFTSNPVASDPVEVGLTALVDQSLIQQQMAADGEPRFQLLGITREYALERLAARGETADVQHAHALYYLTILERVQAQTNERLTPEAADLLRREYANFKTAIQWTLDNGRGEIGLRFVAALWEFWRSSGLLQEGRQITQAVLDQTTGLRLANRAHVHRLVGWLAHDLRDNTTMLRSFQASLDIYEELNDLRGVGLARHGLGEVAQLRGQWEQAEMYLDQSLNLFKQFDDKLQATWSLAYLGRLAFGRGNLARANVLFQESLDAFRALQSARGTIFALGHWGQTCFYLGQFEQASVLFDECLSLCKASHELRSPMAAMAHNYLGETALHYRRLPQAHALIGACISLSKDEGYAGCVDLGNSSAGLLAMHENDRFSAAAYFRESLLLQQLLKEPWRTLLLMEAVAALLVEQTDLLGAARLYGAADHLRATLHVPQLPLYQTQHAHSQSTLKTLLNPAALEEAWAAGQSLTLEQAIAYALRCLE